MSNLISDNISRFTYISSGIESCGSDEFLHSCGELGYVPRIVDMESGFWPKDVPVVYIERKSSPGREKLERYMHTHEGVAALGVLESGTTVELSMAKRYFDVLTWPCSRDELNFRLHKICVPPCNEYDELTQELLWRCNLVGDSPQFLRCIDELRRLAGCDAHILLKGETGTGKELAARAVHYSSARRDGPIIPVNCGALPDTLLENELFGHERGAFTDAKSTQRGLIAEARGGTLFLDEVDTLSMSAQAVLLRFLQDKTYRRLGSEREREANVRIVAATNQDLAQQVDKQLFREDLRYRLEVFICTLPPLRERDDDALVLARYFARQFCAQYGQNQRPLHPDFEHRIKHGMWPGNVRELENEVHRTVVLSADQWFIGDDHLKPCEHSAEKAPPLFQQSKDKVIREFEFNYLTDLMCRADGNVTRAALMAGKERRAFGKLLKKYGITHSQSAQK